MNKTINFISKYYIFIIILLALAITGDLAKLFIGNMDAIDAAVSIFEIFIYTIALVVVIITRKNKKNI